MDRNLFKRPTAVADFKPARYTKPLGHFNGTAQLERSSTREIKAKKCLFGNPEKKTDFTDGSYFQFRPGSAIPKSRLGRRGSIHGKADLFFPSRNEGQAARIENKPPGCSADREDNLIGKVPLGAFAKIKSPQTQEGSFICSNDTNSWSVFKAKPLDSTYVVKNTPLPSIHIQSPATRQPVPYRIEPPVSNQRVENYLLPGSTITSLVKSKSASDLATIEESEPVVNLPLVKCPSAGRLSSIPEQSLTQNKKVTSEVSKLVLDLQANMKVINKKIEELGEIKDEMEKQMKQLLVLTNVDSSEESSAIGASAEQCITPPAIKAHDAGKLYRDMRASFSCLKTPETAAKKSSNLASNCYTPHSLSLRVDQQISSILNRSS